MWPKKYIQRVRPFENFQTTGEPFLARGNFYFVHHGIKDTKFINTNGPDILSRKTRKRKPFMHQTQGRMLDIIATGLRVRV